MPADTRLWHPFADMHAVRGAEMVIARGDGAYVWDDEGRRYLDGTASLWNVNVGHGREEIVEAATAQMRTLASYSAFGAFTNPSCGRLGPASPDRRRNVLVQPEQVLGVVAALDLGQASPRRSRVGGAHAVLALVAEEADVRAVGSRREPLREAEHPRPSVPLVRPGQPPGRPLSRGALLGTKPGRGRGQRCSSAGRGSPLPWIRPSGVIVSVRSRT
jgi:hypothetical protein